MSLYDTCNALNLFYSETQFSLFKVHYKGITKRVCYTQTVLGTFDLWRTKAYTVTANYWFSNILFPFRCVLSMRGRPSEVTVLLYFFVTVLENEIFRPVIYLIMKSCIITVAYHNLIFTYSDTSEFAVNKWQNQTGKSSRYTWEFTSSINSSFTAWHLIKTTPQFLG